MGRYVQWLGLNFGENLRLGLKDEFCGKKGSEFTKNFSHGG